MGPIQFIVSFVPKQMPPAMIGTEWNMEELLAWQPPFWFFPQNFGHSIPWHCAGRGGGEAMAAMSGGL